jgi:outer membrane protein assembly factor BamB
MRSLLSLSVLVLLTGSAIAGDDWPQFRGPTADGHSNATGLPVSWSETENVAWKTPIHDRGWSSPVIWGNQIWLTTALDDGRQLFALCVDRDSGKVLHDVKLFDVEKPEHVASINSYASPSPVIEEGRVYVHFGAYGTACLDTAAGKPVWTRRDLYCDHHEGPGASPILYKNLLIFNVDGRDVQYVVALDKETGKTAWKTTRSIDYSGIQDNQRKAYCTPIVISVAGREQLISPGSRAIFAYDPATGRELWKVTHAGWSITPRPLFAHGLVFCVTDFDRPEFWAIRPDGQGTLGDDHIAWKLRKAVASKPSPVVVDDLIYLLNDEGILQCLEAKTGKLVWKNRIKGQYSSSPFFADGRLYFFNHQGKATVLATGREFKILATNQLDGELLATPAVVGKSIYVRTLHHLYRLEKRD